MYHIVCPILEEVIWRILSRRKDSSSLNDCPATSERLHVAEHLLAIGADLDGVHAGRFRAVGQEITTTLHCKIKRILTFWPTHFLAVVITRSEDFQMRKSYQQGQREEWLVRCPQPRSKSGSRQGCWSQLQSLPLWQPLSKIWRIHVQRKAYVLKTI